MSITARSVPTVALALLLAPGAAIAQGQGPAGAGEVVAAPPAAAVTTPGAERTPAVTLLTWRALGINHSLSADEIAAVGSAPSVKLDNVPVVFAGGGQAGAEASGAVVLITRGEADPAARAADALKQGARAVFLLADDREDWAKARTATVSGGVLEGLSTPAAYGAIAYPAWSKLVAGLGESPRALLGAAAKPGFKAKRLNATMTGTVTTQIHLPG